MKTLFLCFFSLLSASFCFGQVRWQNVDSAYGPLPPTVHLYFTNQPVDTAPLRAFYLIADLKDKGLNFTTDTTLNRRLTPSAFYAKNNQPLVVVNGTFFSFETNRNLNAVVQNGKLVAYNAPVKGRGKDSVQSVYPFKSAIGISKKRTADVAWLFTDSAEKYPSAFNRPFFAQKTPHFTRDSATRSNRFDSILPKQKGWFQVYQKKWKMQTAIGGGPVLLANGEIVISNEEEQMFTGKAVRDKHPRTAMGYTSDNKLIILVVEGRNKEAGGATLEQEARMLKDLGCIEALNLDGGGSSCLLVNGKETITVADKEGQRPVPAVFLIQKKN